MTTSSRPEVPLRPAVGGRRPGRDLRLLPAAIAAWIAAGALVGEPHASGAVAAIAGVAAIAAVAIAARSRGRSGRRDAIGAVALALGAIGLVATTLVLRADVRAPPRLLNERGVVTIELVVTGEVAAGGDRLRGSASLVGTAPGEMPVLVVGATIDRGVGIGTALSRRS